MHPEWGPNSQRRQVLRPRTELATFCSGDDAHVDGATWVRSAVRSCPTDQIFLKEPGPLKCAHWRVERKLCCLCRPRRYLKSPCLRGRWSALRLAAGVSAVHSLTLRPTPQSARACRNIKVSDKGHLLGDWATFGRPFSFLRLFGQAPELPIRQAEAHLPSLL